MTLGKRPDIVISLEIKPDLSILYRALGCRERHLHGTNLSDQVSRAFYHVTSRGNGPKNIYKSKRDREHFLESLGKTHERCGAIIHAYCLMTNHHHTMEAMGLIP